MNILQYTIVYTQRFFVKKTFNSKSFNLHISKTVNDNKWRGREFITDNDSIPWE